METQTEMTSQSGVESQLNMKLHLGMDKQANLRLHVDMENQQNQKSHLDLKPQPGGTQLYMDLQSDVNVKVLSNSELLNKFGRLVQTERTITHLVLKYISEIDMRRLYLPSHSSLFDFLIKEYGYSESAADRRIASARLLRQVPEISEKIETGALNISQLSQVRRAINFVQKTEARKVGFEEKVQLLSKIENSTQKETKLILAQELSIPVIVDEREEVHRNESVTLTMTFSKEQMALLRQAQDLIAHSVPDKKWSEVITYLARKEVDRRTKIKREPSVKVELLPKNVGITSAEKTNEVPMTSETASRRVIEGVNSSAQMIMELAVSARKVIRPNVKKFIFNRDKCCRFKDPRTGKICGCTRFLQVDHIQPIWAGGTNDSTNLQAMCSQPLLSGSLIA